ncbi:uncharacterized protein ABDE67_005953 [Symphorus nematophorus]
MEDFIIDNISLNSTYYNNYEYDEDYFYSAYSDTNAIFILFVVTCIITSIALPLTIVEICVLYSLVQSDQVAPIYVINLLISNLIQLCCVIVEVARPEIWMMSQTGYSIYHLSLVASAYFMVCIALERYLVIACPLWYSSRRNIKISVVVCVVVWALALVFVLILHFRVDIHYYSTILSLFLLLPFPLFIFFLGGTLKALSASRVPPDEKRRIVGILVVLLLIYTVLHLPLVIYALAAEVINNETLWNLFIVFQRLTPLADLTLYVFMRKGTIDKLLACVCCCRMDSNDISSSSV